MSWADLCAESELEPGEMRAFSLMGNKLALFRDEDGSWHATSNVCTHEYALLTDGWLEDGEVECPLHSGRFCIRTGRALCKPAEVHLKVFPVRVQAGRIEADLSAAAQEAKG